MNIKSLKESIQIFSRKAATSINWPPVENDIECAIDEDVVECSEMDSPPYTGIPAPTTLTEDPWFGPAVVSDANKDYMEREYEAFKQDALNYYSDSKEPENIHQMMYERASKYWGTWKEEMQSPGGSENFQSGWNSGNGMGQFK